MTSTKHAHLADKAAALRLQALETHAWFSIGDSASIEVQRQVDKEISAAAKGEHRIFWQDDTVLAHIGLFDELSPYFGCTVQRCILDYQLQSPKALAWVCGQLKDMAPGFSDAFYLPLDAAYGGLLSHPLAMGLGLDSIKLIGDIDAALAWLKTRTATRPADLGLALREMVPSDADTIIAMQWDFYTAYPQFCWFGSQPKYLAMEHRSLQNGHGGIHSRYVLTERGTVVGYGGGDYKDSPIYGPYGGLHLIMQPKWQGRGLGKSLYSAVLKDLKAKGARRILGGTAQPPVLAMGQKMGRQVVTYHLRKETHFPTQHFAAFMP